MSDRISELTAEVSRLTAEVEEARRENTRQSVELQAVLTAARRALQVHRALVKVPDAKVYCAVCRCPKDDGPHYDECPLYPLWTWVEAHDAASDNSAIRQPAPASDPRATPEARERELRRLLFTGHGCTGADLYGDDGEMQDKRCGIDFLRATPEQIGQARQRRARALLAHPPQEPTKGEG